MWRKNKSEVLNKIFECRITFMDQVFSFKKVFLLFYTVSHFDAVVVPGIQ